MAVLDAVAVPAETAPVVDVPVPAATTGGAVRIAALGLWGVVGTLLAYGVLQTAVKAAALIA